MRHGGTFAVILAIYLIASAQGVQLLFPKGPGVLLWSNASIWSTGQVPQDGEDVLFDFGNTTDALACRAISPFYLLVDDDTELIASLIVQSRSRCRAVVVISDNAKLNTDIAFFTGSSALVLESGGVLSNLNRADFNNSFIYGTGTIAGDAYVDNVSILLPGRSTIGVARSCIGCMPGMVNDVQSIEANRFGLVRGNEFGTLSFGKSLELAGATFIKDSWNITHMSGRPENVPIDQIIVNGVLTTNGFQVLNFLPEPQTPFMVQQEPETVNQTTTTPFLKWNNLLVSLSPIRIYKEGLRTFIFGCGGNYCCKFHPDFCSVVVSDPPLGASLCSVPSGGTLGVLTGTTSAACPAAVESCTPTSCENGGLCGQFGCSCLSGFSGSSCQERLIVINGTTTTATTVPASSGPDTLTLALAIGIPLAVLLGVGLALAIFLFHRARRAKRMKEAKEKIRNQTQIRMREL